MAHYETTDIFKGAFLLSNGGNLSGISFNDRHIATFIPSPERTCISWTAIIIQA